MQRKHAAAANLTAEVKNKKSVQVELVQKKEYIFHFNLSCPPHHRFPDMTPDAHTSPRQRRGERSRRVENKRRRSVTPLSPDCQECNNSSPPVSLGSTGRWVATGREGGETHLAELEMLRLKSLLDGVVFPGSTRRGSRGGGRGGGGSRRQAVQHLSNVELLHFPPLRTRRLREQIERATIDRLGGAGVCAVEGRRWVAASLVSPK